MPFWANNTWDEEYGGFLTRLDRRGQRLDDLEKVLMMQVRMIHSLSAAHRHGLRDRGAATVPSDQARLLSNLLGHVVSGRMDGGW